MHLTAPCYRLKLLTCVTYSQRLSVPAYPADWSTCPNAHRGERAARRCPRTYSYTPEPCPEYNKVRPCRTIRNSCVLYRRMHHGCDGVFFSLLRPILHLNSQHTACLAMIGHERRHPGYNSRRGGACLKYVHTAGAELRALLRLLWFVCLQTGACAQGVNCTLAHSVFESWLHPSRFRTQLCCFGSSCKRRICFFGEGGGQLHFAHSSLMAAGSRSGQL